MTELTMTPSGDDKRFGFGANWRSFLEVLDDERSAVAEQSVRDLEFPPEVYTPADQVRRWAHPLPPEFKMQTSMMVGGAPNPPADAVKTPAKPGPPTPAQK